MKYVKKETKQNDIIWTEMKFKSVRMMNKEESYAMHSRGKRLVLVTWIALISGYRIELLL